MDKKSIVVETLVGMVSWNLSYSYMTAECFEKENTLDCISKFFRIPKEKINLKEESESFEELMKEILLVDKKELERFFYLLEKVTGKVKKCYSPDFKVFEKAIAGEYHGIGPFFFLENIYFVEFEKMVVCFMVGNNE